MYMTAKDKKRMIDVFFDGDEEKTSADIQDALDETNELIGSELLRLVIPATKDRCTTLQKKVLDSDMSMDELQRLYDLYSYEAERKFATQPFMDDVLAENQDGKLVSIYYGQDAIDMQRNFRNNQAKVNEWLSKRQRDSSG